MVAQRRDESARTVLFPRLERWARPSMGDDEAGGSYRPYHLNIIPYTFSRNTTVFLSFEEIFVGYTHIDMIFPYAYSERPRFDCQIERLHQKTSDGLIIVSS